MQARLAEESSRLFLRTLQDLGAHPLAAVDALLTAKQYAQVVGPLQVLRLEAREGAAQLVKPQVPRGQTTSFDRPISPMVVKERKMQRACTNPSLVAELAPLAVPLAPLAVPLQPLESSTQGGRLKKELKEGAKEKEKERGDLSRGMSVTSWRQERTPPSRRAQGRQEPLLVSGIGRRAAPRAGPSSEVLRSARSLCTDLGSR